MVLSRQMPYYLLVLIFSTVMILGLFGELFTLPGLPFMFLLTIIFGFIDNFSHLQIFEIIILAAISLASVIVNYLSGFYGAKYFGASTRALIAGVLGFTIGLIFFFPLGGFVGLFLGIFITELIDLPNFIKALKKASGSLLGTLVGVLINFTLAFVYLMLFILFVYK